MNTHKAPLKCRIRHRLKILSPSIAAHYNCLYAQDNKTEKCAACEQNVSVVIHLGLVTGIQSANEAFKSLKEQINDCLGVTSPSEEVKNHVQTTDQP